MTRDLPPPTAEGALIRRTRERIRPRLSIPAAAQRANMSAENWGHVERGYQSMGRGAPARPVIPPAATLAHMAHAVGISPAELDEIGRSDAADLLRDLDPQRHAVLAGVAPTAEASLVGRSGVLRRVVDELRARAHAEKRTIGEILVADGLVEPDELTIPDALPPDPVIVEIEALDIPDENKANLIRIYLQRRAEHFESKRLEK